MTIEESTDEPGGECARETRIDGVDIAWFEQGAGTPLVLLHGLQDSHRTWRRAAPRLAADFRVLMPDLPGHGWSARPDASYSLAWFARLVGLWMARVGAPRAHVCGHSFGAGIAEMMLLAEPERVERLALVSAGGLGREVALALRLAATPLLGSLLTPVVTRLVLPLAVRFAPAAYGHMEPSEARAVVRMSRIPGSDRAFLRSLLGVIDTSGQSVRMFEHIDEYGPLPPIALFWGDDDPVIPVEHGMETVRRTRGVTLTRYPGCGHHPQLDAAGAFALDLRAFLHDPQRPDAQALQAPRRLRPAARPSA